MYAPGAASVGALTPPALRLPAGSVVGALAPAPTVGARGVDNLRRSGGRPVDRNIRARRRARRSRPRRRLSPAGSVVGALAAAGL